MRYKNKIWTFLLWIVILLLFEIPLLSLHLEDSIEIYTDIILLIVLHVAVFIVTFSIEKNIIRVMRKINEYFNLL